MGRIFELADTESLLALRTVFKSFKHRADSLLAYHIDLVFRTPSNIPWVSLRLGESDNERVINAAWHYSRYRAILGRAQIVDTHSIHNTSGFDFPHDHHAEVIHPLFHALDNVHTLRHIGIYIYTQPWPFTTRSKRVVFFLHFHSDFSEYYEMPCFLKGLPLGPIREGVEKAVVNILDWCKLDDFEEAVLRAPIWPHSLRHVVFIFQSEDPPLENRDFFEPLPPMGIFANVLKTMAFTIPLVKYTFVGMLDVDPALFGMDNVASHDNIKQALMAPLVAFKAEESPNRDEIVAAVDSCLHFCTRDEYAASLTGNDFEVETNDKDWLFPAAGL